MLNYPLRTLSVDKMQLLTDKLNNNNFSSPISIMVDVSHVFLKLSCTLTPSQDAKWQLRCLENLMLKVGPPKNHEIPHQKKPELPYSAPSLLFDVSWQVWDMDVPCGKSEWKLKVCKNDSHLADRHLLDFLCLCSTLSSSSSDYDTAIICQPTSQQYLDRDIKDNFLKKKFQFFSIPSFCHVQYMWLWRRFKSLSPCPNWQVLICCKKLHKFIKDASNESKCCA